MFGVVLGCMKVFGSGSKVYLHSRVRISDEERNFQFWSEAPNKYETPSPISSHAKANLHAAALSCALDFFGNCTGSIVEVADWRVLRSQTVLAPMELLSKVFEGAGGRCQEGWVGWCKAACCVGMEGFLVVLGAVKAARW